MRKLNVCYYISSHGFGHATRSIAIIRELIRKNINIIIRANLPEWLITQSFRNYSIKYFKGFETLKVFHNEDLLILEKDKSINYLTKYYRNYEKIIKKEVKFCKNNGIDLILSDIEPSAFEIADKCGIPSIGISNFTWIDIFPEFIPSDSKILKRFENSYRKASFVFRLPFHFEMDYFSKIIDVPLVFRKLTRSPEQVKIQLDIPPHNKLVFIQFGGHYFSTIQKWKQKLSKFYKENPSFVFITNRFSDFQPVKSNTFIKQIPFNDVETQDYIPENIIIGKTGYSLVSEVIGYNSIFFYTIREKWKEDDHLQEGIKKYGIGKFFLREDLINGNWIDYIEEFSKSTNLKSKSKIKKFGQDFIAKYIIKSF